MRQILILILFLIPFSLFAEEGTTFKNWSEFKTFMANFDASISKQPWGHFQTPKINNIYNIRGRIDGIRYFFDIHNASDTLDFETYYKDYCNKKPENLDIHGRQGVYILSGNPDFQAYWTSVSDYVNIATPSLNLRGGGDFMYWDTSDDKYVIHPASDTLPTGSSDDTWSGYHANALNNHVFPGQRPIPSGWKRKRLRFLFIDTINVREGFIKYRKAQHNKIRIDSFIFMRNIGVNPLGQYVTPFNVASPTHDIDNPSGWITTAYVTGINIEGDDKETFASEKSSQDLPFYNQQSGPFMELWIEISYDPTAFTTTPCTGSGRAFIFRPLTIGN